MCLQSLYLAGFQYLKEGQLMAGAQPLVEFVHSAVDSLLHRRVITKDQDTRLDLRCLLDEKKEDDAQNDFFLE